MIAVCAVLARPAVAAAPPEEAVDLRQWEACLFRLNLAARPKALDWKSHAEILRGEGPLRPNGVSYVEAARNGQPRRVLFLHDDKVSEYVITDEILGKLRKRTGDAWLTLQRPGGGFVSDFHRLSGEDGESWKREDGESWKRDDGLESQLEILATGAREASSPYLDMLKKSVFPPNPADLETLKKNLRASKVFVDLAKDELEDTFTKLGATTLVPPQAPADKAYELIFATRLVKAFAQVQKTGDAHNKQLAAEACPLRTVDAAQHLMNQARMKDPTPSPAPASTGAKRPPGTQPGDTLKEKPASGDH